MQEFVDADFEDQLESAEMQMTPAAAGQGCTSHLVVPVCVPQALLDSVLEV